MSLDQRKKFFNRTITNSNKNINFWAIEDLDEKQLSIIREELINLLFLKEKKKRKQNSACNERSLSSD